MIWPLKEPDQPVNIFQYIILQQKKVFCSFFRTHRIGVYCWRRQTSSSSTLILLHTHPGAQEHMTNQKHSTNNFLNINGQLMKKLFKNRNQDRGSLLWFLWLLWLWMGIHSIFSWQTVEILPLYCLIFQSQNSGFKQPVNFNRDLYHQSFLILRILKNGVTTLIILHQVSQLWIQKLPGFV